MKKIKAGIYSFNIKEVTTEIFIDVADGIPLSFIQAPESISEYRKMKQGYSSEPAEKAKEQRQHRELVETCRRIVDRCLDAPKVVKDGVLNDDEMSLNVGLTILSESCNVFKGMTKCSASHAILCHKMGKMYGKTPIEILMPMGGYTALDAFFYNRYAFATAREFNYEKDIA